LSWKWQNFLGFSTQLLSEGFSKNEAQNVCTFHTAKAKHRKYHISGQITNNNFGYCDYFLSEQFLSYRVQKGIKISAKEIWNAY